MASKTDLQAQSLLFGRLPQELRDDIYAQLFASTRLTFGRRPIDLTTGVKIKPPPNGLALLRTCRRAQLEIGNSWLSHVLFCFEDAKTMLDKLSALPTDTLSKIRHMRVCDGTLMFSHLIRPGIVNKSCYNIASVLKLFLGLRLDQLTVLGGSNNYFNSDALGSLVKHGNGWKAPRYITHNSLVLNLVSHLELGSMAFCLLRDIEPRQWQTMLESRDGPASNPSVAIYRAKTPCDYGSILDPDRRVKYELSDVEVEDEQNKEMMVVVKRGRGVDYSENEPFASIDEMRPKFKLYGPPDPKDESDLAQEDIYTDVDGYAWTPLHLDPEMRPHQEHLVSEP